MTVYKATTRFLGADGPTVRYFTKLESAKSFIEYNDNIGEIEEVELIENIDIQDGMTYTDIEYWGGKIKE